MAIGNGNDDRPGGSPMFPYDKWQIHTTPQSQSTNPGQKTAATGDLCLLQISFQQFLPEETCHLLSSPLHRAHRGSSRQQSTETSDESPS